ncbi:MAG TPA: hypothetical protein PLI79_01515 [Mycobacterium sp.]|nr:hypothetical protein [Mycobacterium sp.]
MFSSTNTPDSPAEAAALDLIVRVPMETLDVADKDLLLAALQELTALLHAEGAFTGLSAHDAEQAAGAIAMDFCLRRMGAAESLRARAAVVLGSPTDGPWDSPEGPARALTIAADVLDAWA